MSNNERKQFTKHMKKSAKFSGKLLLWAIPVILIVSVALSFTNIPSWLVVLINLVVGGATCFVVYVIYDKIQQKKEKQPKKKDPFAD